MKNELFLSIKIHTDTLIEQTKTRLQKTLEYKLNKEMETFSLSTPKKLVEEGKWLLGVTSFETTNSVFNITNENISFSNSIPGHWNSEYGEEFINKLNKLLQLRSENEIELHVKEVKKSVTPIIIENSGYNSAGFDHIRNEMLTELKRVKYRDLEEMV